MAQFDVHRLRQPQDPRLAFLLDIQNDLHDGLETRVMLPLVRTDLVPPPIRRLNPRFDIAGESVILLTQDIASVPRQEIGPAIASLKAERDAILGALDLLIIGY
ncbi:CcdB family protein [Ferrovibrio sp.]|uniref:CcdB family protein n=1 Tax=Ferrovibrio sp. TaxID=1917215 RepID=UPI003D2992C2